MTPRDDTPILPSEPEVERAVLGAASALAIPTAEEIFGAEPAQPNSDAEPSPAMEIADRECARRLVEALLEDPPDAKSKTSWGDCPACGGKNTYWQNIETGKGGCRAPECDWRKLRDKVRGLAGAAESGAQSRQSQSEPTIREVCLADIQIKPVPWLWKRRIARGTLTIVEGIEGEGKSTVLCAIGAAVTCGQGLEDMVFAGGAKGVLWLSAEDSPAHVLKPRLLAAGADESRVFVVGEAFTFDDKGVKLVREMAERRKPALIVIDPVFAYAKGDPSKGADARAVLNPLKQIAEDLDCAIVLVRHVGKSKGLGDPRAAGLYSIEWRAAARSVLLCGSDPDSPQIKAITQSKNNLSPFAESIGYTLEEYPPGSEVSRALWTGVSQLTAKRILATISDEDEKAERTSAEDFLREVLKSGEQKAAEVQAAARKNGIAERTLNRVKARLGVQCRNEGFGKGKVWYWRLPDEDGEKDADSAKKPAEKPTDDAPKQAALRLPNEESGNLKASDGNQSTSGEKNPLDCHLAIKVEGESPLTMPSGNLSANFSDNINGSNGLPLDCHVGQNGNLSAAPFHSENASTPQTTTNRKRGSL